MNNVDSETYEQRFLVEQSFMCFQYNLNCLFLVFSRRNKEKKRKREERRNAVRLLAYYNATSSKRQQLEHQQSVPDQRYNEPDSNAVQNIKIIQTSLHTNAAYTDTEDSQMDNHVTAKGQQKDNSQVLVVVNIENQSDSVQNSQGSTEGVEETIQSTTRKENTQKSDVLTEDTEEHSAKNDTQNSVATVLQNTAPTATAHKKNKRQNVTISGNKIKDHKKKKLKDNGQPSTASHNGHQSNKGSHNAAQGNKITNTKHKDKSGIDKKDQSNDSTDNEIQGNKSADSRGQSNNSQSSDDKRNNDTDLGATDAGNSAQNSRISLDNGTDNCSDKEDTDLDVESVESDTEFKVSMVSRRSRPLTAGDLDLRVRYVEESET